MTEIRRLGFAAAKHAAFERPARGMSRAMPDHMRRIKLFGACLLVIVASLPLLPGPGALIIAETLATLEREFPWIARLMDRLQAWSRRQGRRGRHRRAAELLVHARRTF